MLNRIQDPGPKAPAGLLTIQHGRINFPGLLLWLLLVAGSVGITLSVAEHCRGAVQGAFAPVAGETTAHE